MDEVKSTTKICGRCKIEKDIDDFSKNKSKKNGISSECKECKKIFYDLYYKKK